MDRRAGVDGAEEGAVAVGGRGDCEGVCGEGRGGYVIGAGRKCEGLGGDWLLDEEEEEEIEEANRIELEHAFAP